jgi:hypothetical protein
LLLLLLLLAVPVMLQARHLLQLRYCQVAAAAAVGQLLPAPELSAAEQLPAAARCYCCCCCQPQVLLFSWAATC